VIEPRGDSSPGHHQHLGQLRRLERVRRTRPAQRGEDIEVGAREAVAGEDDFDPPAEQRRQLGDPSEHPDRGEVKVGPFTAPRPEDGVDVI